MGLENLIDATRDLVAEIPDLLVHIAGAGPLKSELEKRIHEHNLANNVRLLGRIEDDVLPLCFRAADVSIVPTVALEGFGMITLESLAAGTPVVVTPVGGLPEVVRPLADELVLDGLEVEDIVIGLREILLGRRRIPSEAECRKYVEQNFGWPVIAKRIRELYAEAIN
jgi:glycosyltransferase involved in cell wall biosynthesis